MLTAYLARPTLTQLSTPLEKMPRLLIKRDGQTGLVTGGVAGLFARAAEMCVD